MQSFVNTNPAQFFTLDAWKQSFLGRGSEKLQSKIPFPVGIALTSIVPGFPSMAHQEASAACV